MDSPPPGVLPWMARGRGLGSEQPVVGRGRGLPGSAAGLGFSQSRGFIASADAGLMQFGRGAAPPASEPLPWLARGLPVLPERGGFGRARGLLFSSPEPSFRVAKETAPLGLEPRVGRARLCETTTQGLTEKKPPEGLPKGEVATQNTLISMFRGMGIEPCKNVFGRGGPPVERGAAGNLTAPVGDLVISPGSKDQPEEIKGRGSSFLGRELPSQTVMKVGSSVLPFLQFGRGPAVAPSLPPGPLQSAASPLLPPTPHSPHARTKHPLAPPQGPSVPPDSFSTKRNLKMEAPGKPLNKAGAKGTPLNLGSNQIPIHCSNESVYQYHVTFTPNVESVAMRFGMMKEHRSTTGQVVAFDGSILFLPFKLGDVVLLKSERRTDNKEIEIKVQMTKILPPSSDLCIPFYNVVLRRVMKMVGLQVVGRNHYDPQSAVFLSKHRLQVWPGYATSIKRSDGGLYLSVDVSHKVLRNESALNAMQVMYEQSTENFQDECTKELVGSVVITRYNNHTYRIDGIEWNKSPKDTFTLADGSETTFVDYYSKNYGITIKEKAQPLLVHRPKERSRPGRKQLTGEILLVPELSFMTGIPDKMRKDFRAMKDLTMHINVSGEQYTNSIKQLLKNISTNPETLKELSRWGLEINTDIMLIKGRILPTETICLQSASVTVGADMSWSREVVRDAAISCVPLNVWSIFYPRRCAEQAEELVVTFQKVAGPMGLRLQQPIRVQLRDDRTETYIKSIHSQLTSKSGMQMVVCIITGNRDDLYCAIKKLCSVKSPIPSQAINVRTISQPQKLRSVAQRILLQMNCKLGGELWTVNVPLKHLMVIGVDVHHDIRQHKRSVMGFVASLNSLLTRWYSRVTFQTPHEEMISGFQVCLLAALQKYYEVNHNLPEKIVVYRDGVSDSQLKVVEAYEIPQLLKCFQTFPNYEPKLVFIVVQKRINTTLHNLDGNRFAAPPPGTVLDHTLTQEERMDFYLLAHQIRQGCGLPTHYICIYNTANLTPDHLQRLTFKMCHLYWNWPGTIRVPAPCKYAHKLAYLSGQFLHSEPAIQLADRLHFL